MPTQTFSIPSGLLGRKPVSRLARVPLPFEAATVLLPLVWQYMRRIGSFRPVVLIYSCFYRGALSGRMVDRSLRDILAPSTPEKSQRLMGWR